MIAVVVVAVSGSRNGSRRSSRSSTSNLVPTVGTVVDVESVLPAKCAQN